MRRNEALKALEEAAFQNNVSLWIEIYTENHVSVMCAERQWKIGAIRRRDERERARLEL